MILFIALLLVGYVFFVNNYKKTGILPLFVVFLPLVFYLLFVVEVGISQLDYLSSDEVGYWNFDFTKIDIGNIDRLYWYVVNYIVKNLDIGGKLAIKLINIPLLLITLYLLRKMFFSDNRIFLIIFLLPYFGILATKNLRDISLLLFIIATFYFRYYQPRILLFILFSLLMLITRPVVGMLTLLIIEGSRLLKLINLKSFFFHLKVKKMVLLYVFFIGILLVAIFSIPYVRKRINSYTYYVEYYTVGDGYQKRIESRADFSTGNIIGDYTLGAIRYIVTPIPTSLIGRIIFGNNSSWGILDDIIRLIHQVFYYYFLLYVFLNARYIYIKLRQLEPAAKQLLLLLIMYLPMYTFYGFGVSHQRNKLPFQLAIFLLFIINKNLKILELRKLD